MSSEATLDVLSVAALATCRSTSAAKARDGRERPHPCASQGSHAAGMRTSANGVIKHQLNTGNAS